MSAERHPAAAAAERLARGRPVHLVPDASGIAVAPPGAMVAITPAGSPAGDALSWLRQLEPGVPEGVEVVGTVPSARNLRALEDAVRRGVTGDERRATRDEIEQAVRGARLDLAWLAPVPDPDLGWVPPPVEGTIDIERGPVRLTGGRIDAVEEATAAYFEMLVRARVLCPPACSIVVLGAGRSGATVAGDALRRDPPAVTHEVITISDGSSATAANAGLRAARGDIMVFLAGDDGPTAGAIDRLVARLRATGAGAVGPQLVHPVRGWTAGAGFALARDLVPYPIHRHRPRDSRAFARPAPVWAIPIHGLTVRRGALVAAGGFDEGLPAFWDVDLCLRLAARDRPSWFDPTVVVLSEQAGTHAPRSLEPARAAFTAKWRERLRSDDEARAAADGVAVHELRARGWYQPAAAGGGAPDGEVPAGAPTGREPRARPAVLWTGPVLDRSGYANEARTLTTGLHRRGVPTHLNPIDIGLPRVTLDDDRAALLEQMVASTLPRSFVHVCHLPYYGLDVHPHAVANVARTMWETDRLPERAAAWTSQVDEVWVPKEQNVELYVDAGVPRDRVVVVPTAIDEELFGADRPRSVIAGASGFVFLSLFFWSPRKGWDLLVRAYVEEFAAHEDVTLVIAGNATTPADAARRMTELAGFIRHRLGRSPASCPRIIHLPVIDATPQQIAHLHRAADAFVLATRGEGAGLPIGEAMASGVPVIVPRDCVSYVSDDTAFLVDAEWVDIPPEVWPVLPFFRGHRWAEPSVEGLRAAMRRAIDEPDEARARAARGRAHVLDALSTATVADRMIERLRHLTAR